MNRVITLASNKKIYVYDDFLPLQSRANLWNFVNNSLFRIGWADGETETSNNKKFIHSAYSDQDDERAGLLSFIKKTEINEHIKNLKHTKSVVNLSVPSDVYFPHSHSEKLAILYYVNLEWQPHWHGETVFFTEDLKEIELSLAYTPGRIIVFDASIPHALRPQSTASHNYRFTYAMFFDEK